MIRRSVVRGAALAGIAAVAIAGLPAPAHAFRVFFFAPVIVPPVVVAPAPVVLAPPPVVFAPPPVVAYPAPVAGGYASAGAPGAPVSRAVGFSCRAAAGVCSLPNGGYAPVGSPCACPGAGAPVSGIVR